MASVVEGMGLTALKKRNLGGMVNHSLTPNAESQCIFDCGAELVIIIAKSFIAKGHQILIDYSKHYRTRATMKAQKLEKLSSVPPLSLEN